MAPKNNDSGSRIFENDDPEAVDAELTDRLLASAAGLPRVCTLKTPPQALLRPLRWRPALQAPASGARPGAVSERAEGARVAERQR
jgi:hypothetical protein